MNRFLLVTLLFSLLHCKPTHTEGNEDVQLENTKWILAEMNGIPLTSMADSKVVYFILDENKNTMSGFAGCNSISGGYELSGNKISFQTASTRMMCGPAAMEVEQFLLNALTSADGYRINGDVLQLFQGETSLAILRRERP